MVDKSNQFIDKLETIGYFALYQDIYSLDEYSKKRIYTRKEVPLSVCNLKSASLSAIDVEILQ